MSTPKGYTSQEKDDRLKAQFTTVTPIGLSKFALDVRDSGTVYVVGSDAVEASSTTSVINATAHAAKKGDRVRFTSGALASIEADVWEVTANTITLGQTLPSAPVAAVTFDILRPVSLTVGSDGTITTTVSPSPLIFTRDGVDQEVTEDTVTPANNRPLPVLLTGASGTVNITAGNLEVALDSASDSVAAVQSGTWNINNVSGTVSLPAGAATSADQATGNASLSSIDGKLNSLGQKAMAASAPVVIASDQSAIPVSGTVTVGTEAATVADGGVIPAVIKVIGGYDGSNVRAIATDAVGQLQVDVLTIPAVTATNLDIRDLTSVSDSVAAVQSGAWSVSVSSSALPTGAATEATLASIDGNIVVCDTGSVTISAALPAGTNNIGDVDVLSLPSIPAGSNNIGDVDVLSLPAIPAGSNLIGSVDVNLDVVDFLDTNPVLDTGSTNIPASAGSPLTAVASLAANVKKIRVNDTTGKFIGIYTGAAASEVLQAVAGPGIDGDIEVKMNSGERVSLRHMSNVAISSGELLIQFYG